MKHAPCWMMRLWQWHPPHDKSSESDSATRATINNQRWFEDSDARRVRNDSMLVCSMPVYVQWDTHNAVEHAMINDEKCNNDTYIMRLWQWQAPWSVTRISQWSTRNDCRQWESVMWIACQRMHNEALGRQDRQGNMRHDCVVCNFCSMSVCNMKFL